MHTYMWSAYTLNLLAFHIHIFFYFFSISTWNRNMPRRRQPTGGRGFLWSTYLCDRWWQRHADIAIYINRYVYVCDVLIGCVCVHVYVCTHECMHTQIYAYTCTHTQAYIYAYKIDANAMQTLLLPFRGFVMPGCSANLSSGEVLSSTRRSIKRIHIHPWNHVFIRVCLHVCACVNSILQKHQYFPPGLMCIYGSVCCSIWFWVYCVLLLHQSLVWFPICISLHFCSWIAVAGIHDIRQLSSNRFEIEVSGIT